MKAFEALAIGFANQGLNGEATFFPYPNCSIVCGECDRSLATSIAAAQILYSGAANASCNRLALALYSQSIGYALQTISLERLDSESPHPHSLVVEHTIPPAC
ncbi:hypothetical protein H6F77_16155 [Microcoleus sp. FACHB-831]|uniref:hypothetical protein n=1 Tax=Microcoleus sp. FACHB-831 TaxID=2692827 RepID=UPI0016878218|nr:hypothetical protein [Microcoleus sp. FACHB-831]MBD1922601.1 hypothetical protein [Microcoleus sp. FACHB-831]